MESKQRLKRKCPREQVFFIRASVKMHFETKIFFNISFEILSLSLSFFFIYWWAEINRKKSFVRSLSLLSSFFFWRWLYNEAPLFFVCTLLESLFSNNDVKERCWLEICVTLTRVNFIIKVDNYKFELMIFNRKIEDEWWRDWWQKNK